MSIRDHRNSGGSGSERKNQLLHMLHSRSWTACALATSACEVWARDVEQQHGGSVQTHSDSEDDSEADEEAGKSKLKRNAKAVADSDGQVRGQCAMECDQDPCAYTLQAE